MARGPKRPARRPRLRGQVIRACYTPELGREICRRIAAGELWTRIAGRGRMPACGTLYAWRAKYPAFAEAFAQAREIAAEGGGALPSNLHLIEGDPMTTKEVTQCALARRKPRRADGSAIHVPYSKAITQKICERLAAGESWSHFCKEAGMPSYGIFYHWRRTRPEFADAVEEARLIAAEARFEKALEVAMAATAATVNADKLKVATLMRHAELLDPSRFSDRRAGGGERNHVQTFVIRRFERAFREDGTSYIEAIDSVQQVER
jgi:hypothetical protein